MKLFVSAALVSLAVLAACTVRQAVNSGVAIPRERRTECEANCGSLGMRLGSVVLIMDSVGCVCVPADAPPSTADSASAVSGGALIAVTAEEEARHNNQAHMTTTTTTSSFHH